MPYPFTTLSRRVKRPRNEPYVAWFVVLSIHALY